MKCVTAVLVVCSQLVLCVGECGAERHAEAEVLLDFETPGLSKTWNAKGQIKAARAPIPSPNGGKLVNGPTGAGLELSTGGGALIHTKAGALNVPWEEIEVISFWVYRGQDEAVRRGSSTIELQLHEKDGGSRYWRKAVCDQRGGWKKFEVPLRWMAWGGNAVPDWKRINRLAFWFRDPAEVVIDHVTVRRGGEGSARLTPRVIAEAAFGADAEVNITKNNRLALVSDVEGLSAEGFLDHAQAVADDVLKTFPWLSPPPLPTPFVLFAKEEAYRTFPGRFAARQLRVAPRVESDGYTFQGIATTWIDQRREPLRPVFTQEFVHAMLARTVRIPNSGEWLHEGIGNYFQLKHYPQGDFADTVLRGVRDPNRRLTLPTLCSGNKIPTRYYWQAVTVVELLMQDETYRPRLPEVVDWFRENGATNLDTPLKQILKTDWGAFEKRWLDHCHRAYGDNEA
ncbi:MAG: hypothetical protein AAGB00_02925 [Planctomycetota bacterium]